MKQQSQNQYPEINDEITWYELIERKKNGAETDVDDSEDWWRPSPKQSRKLFILQKKLERKITCFDKDFMSLEEVFSIRYAETFGFDGDWRGDYSCYPCWSVKVGRNYGHNEFLNPVEFACYTTFEIREEHRGIGLGGHLLNELITWLQRNHGELPIRISISLMQGTPEIVADKLYGDRKVKNGAFVKDLQIKESSFEIVPIAKELASLRGQERELRSNINGAVRQLRIERSKPALYQLISGFISKVEWAKTHALHSFPSLQTKMMPVI